MIQPGLDLCLPLVLVTNSNADFLIHPDMPNILIIDDEESICWGLSRLCQRMGHEFQTASSVESGLALVQKRPFDLIIMDVRLPGVDGLSAIKLFHNRHGRIPIITITAFGDLKTAITAIQNGAFEYIVKPFDLERVQRTIEQAIAAQQIRSASVQTEKQSGIPGLVGTSAVIQEVYKHIALTTTTDSPVLITGETGTGKELAARSIHQFSTRCAGPFVAVNIASLNPSLAESELFGHVQGAFTGADRGRSGLIEQACGGTLFLDEVAEIPLDIQVKLLRVLDLGEVTPVGSNAPIKTNFRLISATHRDLSARITAREFRHDLFYRLRTFEIHLPPLRERTEDIPQLVEHFLAIDDGPLPTISQEFTDALQKLAWPGNIRELRSVVQRAAVIARGGVLTADHIEPAAVSTEIDSDRLDLDADIRRLVSEWVERHWMEVQTPALFEAFLELVEPAILTKAFQLSGQQYSSAARRLGIHRTTFSKKLDRLGPGSL